MSSSLAREKTALGVLTPLGDGGEGIVYRCSADPGMAYKEFKPVVLAEVDRASLEESIAFPGSLAPADRRVLEERTVWPAAIVTDGGRLTGFLMPLIGAEYFVSHGRRGEEVRGVNDWNKLAFRRDWLNNPNINSTSPTLLDDEGNDDQTALLGIILQLAEVFAFMHRHDRIVGDVSGRNIIWSTDEMSKYRVRLIDCDSIRRAGSRGVTRPKNSPDWIDPFCTTETTLESDLYKLSLAIFRGYFSAGVAGPQTRPITLDASSMEVLSLCTRGTQQDDRPSADDWVNGLTRLVAVARLDGRPVLELDLTGPVVPPPDPADEPDRPTIDWR